MLSVAQTVVKAPLHFPKCRGQGAVAAPPPVPLLSHNKTGRRRPGGPAAGVFLRRPPRRHPNILTNYALNQLLLISE